MVELTIYDDLPAKRTKADRILGTKKKKRK